MSEIERIGVLGAGTMGAGIAQVAAEAGLEVLIHDPLDGAYERSRTMIAGFLARKVAKEQLTEDEARAVLNRMRQAPTLEELAAADFVIEAIPEELDLKRNAFRRLDSAAPAGTFVAAAASITSEFPRLSSSFRR